MHRNFLAVLASMVIFGLASAPADAQTGQQRAEAAGRGLIGMPAPTLTLRTIDGETIDLSHLYGKQAVYLKFWATWCVPCMQQMPHFEHTYETAGPGLAVIALNVGIDDSLDNVRRVIQEKQLKMPVVIDDGRLAAAFNLRVTPQHIVIGRDGRIEYVGQQADEQLDRALRDAQAPSPAGNRAQGVAQADIVHYGVGDTVPDLAATTLDGGTFRARDANERRPTVLVFLLPWCEGYFTTSRPELSASCRQVREQVASLSGRNDRVRWLGVASGVWSTPAELREYGTSNAVRIPLTMDESGEWFRAFDVMHPPTIVIADASGKIVRRVEGFAPDLGAEIERLSN
jgi:peroxiredoxin